MVNSRKYWHCLKEDSEPVHLTCDTDGNGEFMMWDLAFDGCNYAAQTDCGDREICDDCNDECWSGGGGEDGVDCGHDMGQCQLFYIPTPLNIFANRPQNTFVLK